MSKKISERIAFLKRWMKNPMQVGAICQTSKTFVNKTMDEINWNAKNIIELGAGLGNVTKEIIKNLKPGTNFKAVEIDSVFSAQLKTRFPQAEIINGSAAELEKLMPELVGKVDVVVSILPFMSFKPELKKQIIDSIEKMLKKDGYFLQGTYHYKPSVESPSFTITKKATVWKNVPPIRLFKYNLK